MLRCEHSGVHCQRCGLAPDVAAGELQLAERALAAGKAVLQEKPIAQTAADAFAAVARHRAHAGTAVWAIAENYRCFATPGRTMLDAFCKNTMFVCAVTRSCHKAVCSVQVGEGVPRSSGPGSPSRQPREAGSGEAQPPHMLPRSASGSTSVCRICQHEPLPPGRASPGLAGVRHADEREEQVLRQQLAAQRCALPRRLHDGVVRPLPGSPPHAGRGRRCVGSGQTASEEQ